MKESACGLIGQRDVGCLLPDAGCIGKGVAELRLPMDRMQGLAGALASRDKWLAAGTILFGSCGFGSFGEIAVAQAFRLAILDCC
jgi:hypothetical protein